MGWTVLYIAFGVVALWLLGEVLLQYKARLRWRLLAFFGFLGVVMGVLMPSVWVIGAGAATFAVGQTFVTLSFRRGFSTGWAIGGGPGSSRRRRDPEMTAMEPLDAEPALEISELEQTAAYQPEPLPDDTGQYGVYDRGDDEPERQPQPEQQDAYAQGGIYAEANSYYQNGYPADYESAYQPDYQPDYESAYQSAPADPYAGNYGYGGEQPAYAAYSDPYIGNTSVPAQPQPYESWDAYGATPYQGGVDHQYATGTYDTQAYAPGYDTGQYQTQQPYSETPPGGVWVPQQREAEPAEQPYPYPYPYQDGTGYQGPYYEDPQQQRY